MTLPKAELLDINIDTINKESYIHSKDGLIKNKITADDQTFAINSAQTAMAENVKNDTSLLMRAQTRAKELIANYINNLGQLSDTEYQIIWISE